MNSLLNAGQKRRFFTISSIKIKLVLFNVILTFAAIVATVIPTLYLLNQHNVDLTDAQVKQSMQGLVTTIDEYQNNALNFGALIAMQPAVVTAIKNKDADAVLQAVGPMLQKSKLDFATITDETGTVIVRTHEATRGDNVANQGNVQNALKGNAFAAVESGSAVKFSARAGTPVKDEAGKVIGVISAGYYISNDKVVDQIKTTFGTDATLFLGDIRVATTIMKDGQRVLNTKLNETIAAKVIGEGQEYTGQAEILGNQYTTSYKPILGPDKKVIGVLFVGKSLEEIAKTQNKVALTVGGISCIVLLVILLFSTQFAKRITHPIRVLVTAMEYVAKGDLSKSVATTANDEIGSLAIGYNKMLEHLRVLIDNVNSSAQRLAEAARSLTISGEQSSQAISEVADSIMELTNGAEKQQAAIEDTSNGIGQLAQKIEQVAQNAGNAAKLTNQAISLSQTGSSAVTSAVAQMNTIETAVIQASSVVTKLGERSQEIRGIVDAIAGIAGQTNLLALNAAIEAARAGEQGRGFAVVAEEVRKLAEQSQESAQNVADLINEIQKDTNLAVVSMSEGTREVKMGTEAVASAGSAFMDIAASVKAVASEVTQISSASQQMTNNSEKMVQSVERINQVSAEAVKQTKNVSGSVEKQSEAMAEIAASSQDLTSMADTLTKHVDQFSK